MREKYRRGLRSFPTRWRVLVVIALGVVCGCVCLFRRAPGPRIRKLAAKYAPVVIIGRVVYRNCDRWWPFIYSPNKSIYRGKKEMWMSMMESFRGDTLTVMLDSVLICKAVFTSYPVWGETFGTIVLPLDTVSYRWVYIKDGRDSVLYRIELVGVTDNLLVFRGKRWGHRFHSGLLYLE